MLLWLIRALLLKLSLAIDLLLNHIGYGDVRELLHLEGKVLRYSRLYEAFFGYHARAA